MSGTGRSLDGPGPAEALQDALTELEQGLRAAFNAIEQIRSVLSSGRPPATPVAEPAPLRVVPSETVRTPSREAGSLGVEGANEDPYTPFERLWDRMEDERNERMMRDAADEPERRGLQLLPQVYFVTVEDRERRVDLVPLHRALQGVQGIEEITLVSFTNGVPVVSLRAKHELDLEQLRSVVGSTLRRDCELIPQDTGRVFLRLASQSLGV